MAKYITVRLTVKEAESLLIRANSGSLEYGEDDEPQIAKASLRAELKIREQLNKMQTPERKNKTVA